MKIIFVCTANVCRSPLAEGYLKSLLRNQPVPGIEISSAGVSALAGAAPFDCAIEVARQFDFDISAKRSLQLTPALIKEADRIYCMETWQASAANQMDPRSSAKIGLLGAFHPAGNRLFQIPDPESFTTPAMLVTFRVIQKAVEGIRSSLISK